jgi:hypothetical protein
MLPALGGLNLPRQERNSKRIKEVDMMTFQHNKKEKRQPFNINGRLFFANLLTTFKNLFEAGKGILKNGYFYTCGTRGQSVMEYFIILIFISIVVGAAVTVSGPGKSFLNSIRDQGDQVFNKARDRMTKTTLYASSDGNLLLPDCDSDGSNGRVGAMGVNFDEETGVPIGTFTPWLTDSDHMANISCVDYNNWFPGTFSSGGGSRYWFNISAPGGATNLICLTVTGSCAPSPLPGPGPSPQPADAQAQMYY